MFCRSLFTWVFLLVLDCKIRYFGRKPMKHVISVHFTDTFSINIFATLRYVRIGPVLCFLHNIFAFANKLYTKVISKTQDWKFRTKFSQSDCCYDPQSSTLSSSSSECLQYGQSWFSVMLHFQNKKTAQTVDDRHPFFFFLLTSSRYSSPGFHCAIYLV